jgi:hypothetical protein
MKQNLIKILHSELVKKKCMLDLLSGLVIIGDLSFLKKKFGLLSQVPAPFKIEK